MTADEARIVGRLLCKLEKFCNTNNVGLFPQPESCVAVWIDGWCVGTFREDEGGDGSRFVFTPENKEQ